MGGAEQCTAQLAARLDPARFEPIVISLAPPPPQDQSSCVAILSSAGIQPHFLHARHVGHLPRVLRQLTALLRNHSIQLVQSFLFHANLVSRWAGRRIDQYSRPLGSHPQARCIVLSGIRVAERGRRWHLWLDRWTHQWVDRYVCVSQAVADFTATVGHIPREKIVVIPNGIEWEKYPAGQPADLRDLGIPQDRKVIVAIGRFEPQKGFSWLVASARNWLELLPDCDLLLVGDGPLRPALQQEVARQGLANRIHFAGFRTDVPEILARSALLVLPSQWEGMPNVVLEAMASGLPVVATRVEGVLELLGPTAEEQTVPYGDTHALADRVGKIMGDCTLADRLSRENQQRARQEFSIDRMVQAYQDLWERLLLGTTRDCRG